jgi:pimeloyl-ACP methyl ester carboxylesterase
MAFFIYQSKNIYYEEIGEGAPLLLLHGNTASSRMFSGIAPELAQDYRVILIDFLGYGKSDRIQALPTDLWYDQAMQVICFLQQKNYNKVYLIGTSGGALAALNVALEQPNLVKKLIADSFEGECAIPMITQNLRIDRENSKCDSNAKAFYEAMNGADWENVVDKDTEAILIHSESIASFFHKPLTSLKPEVLFTGSRKDEFITDGFYDYLFQDLIHKVRDGQQYLFDQGNHPAILSNQEEFLTLSKKFFEEATI